jgi:hypothetical protein
MPRRRPLCTFTLDSTLIDGLEHVRRREGTSASETVRRALAAWLGRKGVVFDLEAEALFADAPRNADADPGDSRALDEGDLILIQRALKRLRVGKRDEDRRRRLLAQLHQEIEELIEA